MVAGILGSIILVVAIIGLINWFIQDKKQHKEKLNKFENDMKELNNQKLKNGNDDKMTKNWIL